MVLLTPFSQGTHLLSVGHLIVVGDQAYHHCVISKFDDDVRAVCGCTVVCIHGVQEWDFLMDLISIRWISEVTKVCSFFYMHFSKRLYACGTV